MQKLIFGLFTYLYSDEDPSDISNKENIAEDVLALIETTPILKNLKKQAEYLLNNDGIHQMQTQDELRK